GVDGEALDAAEMGGLVPDAVIVALEDVDRAGSARVVGRGRDERPVAVEGRMRAEEAGARAPTAGQPGRLPPAPGRVALVDVGGPAVGPVRRVAGGRDEGTVAGEREGGGEHTFAAVGVAGPSLDLPPRACTVALEEDG